MTLNELAKSRGFTEEELSEWGIRIEGDVVAIPTLGRSGAWYERIYNPHGNPKYRGPKGAPAHLYNPLGLGPNTDEVWIAEGEFDTLSLIVAGADAVGVLGAGNFRAEWALLFSEAYIVLALDPDDAGEKSMDKLAALWPAGQVSRFDPSPYEDINDWLQADREGLVEAVRDH